MDDVALEVTTDPRPEEVEALGRGLDEHARPVVDRPGFRPLAVFARDGGRLVGGVSAMLNWNWVDIKLVWVEEGRRHTGLGSRLLQAIEDAARERGARHAHLDTFSYQARPFYERHGYRVFASLDDYPPGHQRHFLRKDLDRDGARAARTAEGRER